MIFENEEELQSAASAIITNYANTSYEEALDLINSISEISEKVSDDADRLELQNSSERLFIEICFNLLTLFEAIRSVGNSLFLIKEIDDPESKGIVFNQLTDDLKFIYENYCITILQKTKMVDTNELNEQTTVLFTSMIEVIFSFGRFIEKNLKQINKYKKMKFNVLSDE